MTTSQWLVKSFLPNFTHVVFSQISLVTQCSLLTCQQNTIVKYIILTIISIHYDYAVLSLS